MEYEDIKKGMIFVLHDPWMDFEQNSVILVLKEPLSESVRITAFRIHLRTGQYKITKLFPGDFVFLNAKRLA